MAFTKGASPPPLHVILSLSLCLCLPPPVRPANLSVTLSLPPPPPPQAWTQSRVRWPVEPALFTFNKTAHEEELGELAFKDKHLWWASNRIWKCENYCHGTQSLFVCLLHPPHPHSAKRWPGHGVRGSAYCSTSFSAADYNHHKCRALNASLCAADSLMTSASV